MAINLHRLRRALPLSSSLLHQFIRLPQQISTSSSLPNLLPASISSTSIPAISSSRSARPFTSTTTLFLADRRKVFDPDTDEIGPDTILFEGCDYNHWLITVDFPKDSDLTREQKIDFYINIAAQVFGSVEEAKKKIYALSTTTYEGFQVECSEETSNKFQSIPGVVFVLPDSYIDPVNKEYGGDKYVNGEIFPRPPPVHYGRRSNRDRRPREQMSYQQGSSAYNNQGTSNYETRNHGQNYGPPPSRDFGSPPPQQNFGPPSPQQNFGAPPPLQRTFGSPPPPQRNFGSPPPPQQNFGTPPPSQQNFGTPPPSQQNFGTPPSPQLNFGTPPPSHQNFGTPPPLHQNFGTPPPSHQNFGSPPPSQQNFDSPPPSQQNFGSPPPPQQNFVPQPPLRSYGPPPLQQNHSLTPPRLNYGQPSPQLSYGQPSSPQQNYGQKQPNYGPPPQQNYSVTPTNQDNPLPSMQSRQNYDQPRNFPPQDSYSLQDSGERRNYLPRNSFGDDGKNPMPSYRGNFGQEERGNYNTLGQRNFEQGKLQNHVPAEHQSFSGGMNYKPMQDRLFEQGPESNEDKGERIAFAQNLPKQGADLMSPPMDRRNF